MASATSTAIASISDQVYGATESPLALQNAAAMQELLDLRPGRELEQLFATARSIRERYWGNAIFLYGFVYFSTHCRNQCAFCGYHGSSKVPRYRLGEAEILDISSRLEQDGVHLVDLTMGEDPYYMKDGRLASLVRSVRKETALPIMVSPGVLGRKELQDIQRAGADWYACYQETHNPELFSRLRPGQDFHTRMRSKAVAKKEGMLVEEGVMLGVGESALDLCNSMAIMREMGAAQVRAMSFVPQPGSPMANVQPGPSRRESIMIALLRIMFPNIMIPASLDVEGLDGLRARLDAGANLVTSILPSDCGLGGVANPTLDVGNGHRSATAVRRMLGDMDLRPGTVGEYSRYVRRMVAP